MKKESDRRGSRRWICWRRIVSEEYRPRTFGRAGTSVRYKLECGHTEIRKGSIEIKGERLRCRDCRLERGG